MQGCGGVVCGQTVSYSIVPDFHGAFRVEDIHSVVRLEVELYRVTDSAALQQATVKIPKKLFRQALPPLPSSCIFIHVFL